MTDRADNLTRLVGDLAPAERRQVEDVAALLAETAPPFVPPRELEERTLEAVRLAAAGRSNGKGSGRAFEHRRTSTRRRFVLAGAAALALVAGLFAGIALDRGGGLPGTPELEATLRAPGGATASADVRKTGIGRVIDFRTDALPILREGRYYELWFVGPGDRPGAPNRISAGTFHPDADGRSNVRFAAAVDPANYPGLAVTAEPGDGDPAPSLPDVMRSRSQP